MASSKAVRVCLRRCPVARCPVARCAAGRLAVRVPALPPVAVREIVPRPATAVPAQADALRLRAALVTRGVDDAPHSAGELPKPLENQRESRLTCSCKNNRHLRAVTVRIVRVQISYKVPSCAREGRDYPSRE